MWAGALLEIARALIADGHESLVVSNGGRMVAQLEAEAQPQPCLSIKSAVLSLANPPAAQASYAASAGYPACAHAFRHGWRTLRQRHASKSTPHLISTVHGFYSINRYSPNYDPSGKSRAVSDSVVQPIKDNCETARQKILCAFTGRPAGISAAISHPRNGSIRLLKIFQNWKTNS